MTGIRVGMKLGKGEAQDAKRTAYLCMLSQAFRRGPSGGFEASLGVRVFGSRRPCGSLAF